MAVGDGELDDEVDGEAVEEVVGEAVKKRNIRSEGNSFSTVRCFPGSPSAPLGLEPSPPFASKFVNVELHK